MKIRITQSCAGPGGTWRAGDIIEYEKDLMWMLNGGLAVPVREALAETADKPVHKGRGVYELPDGRRIKGKQAAYAALEG